MLELACPLPDLERLRDVLHEGSDIGDARVAGEVRGELRPVKGGAAEVWLHLQAQVEVPMTCQRCLGPVREVLEIDRAFRFVADEAAAAALDEDLEDDVLVLSARFDVQELLEDELLLALPLVPRHETCPQPLPEVRDDLPEADEAAPHPFAALAGFKPRSGG